MNLFLRKRGVGIMLMFLHIISFLNVIFICFTQLYLLVNITLCIGYSVCSVYVLHKYTWISWTIKSIEMKSNVFGILVSSTLGLLLIGMGFLLKFNYISDTHLYILSFILFVIISVMLLFIFGIPKKRELNFFLNYFFIVFLFSIGLTGSSNYLFDKSEAILYPAIVKDKRIDKYSYVLQLEKINYSESNIFFLNANLNTFNDNNVGDTVFVSQKKGFFNIRYEKILF